MVSARQICGVLLVAMCLGGTYSIHAAGASEPPNPATSPDISGKIEDANRRFEEVQRLLGQGERFQTEEFQLWWAREAYRCGKPDGAFKVWKALAGQGSRQARFILSLLDEWTILAEDGSPTAQYALQLFRPGDGTAELCKMKTTK